MNKKKLKLITEILAIVVIILVSFVGVYKQDGNKMKNQVKGFKYGSNLDGYREIVLEPVSNDDSDDDLEDEDSADKEESEENSEESENKENDEESNDDDSKDDSKKYSEDEYKKSKDLIEKRLQLLNVEDYIISQNLDSESLDYGKIYIYIPENSETDHIISNLTQTAKFEIKDSENDEVFINNDGLKNVAAVYNTTEEGTTVFLQFQFDKEATKALKDLSSGEYKTKPEEENKEDSENKEENSENENSENQEENTENSEDEDLDESEEEKDTQKKIAMSIDDSDLITTSFDEPIENGMINLSMNRASTDDSEIRETLKSAATISNILNSGVMPVSYEVSENSYVQTDITQNTVCKICIGIAVITAIGLVVLILKYKANGLFAAISYIGFIALDLLIVRYTNVSISIESLTGAVVVLLINYIIVSNLLKLYNNNNEEIKVGKLLAKEVITYLPIFIISVIFVFTKVGVLSDLGMFVFWGIITSFIYNYTLTRDMIKK